MKNRTASTKLSSFIRRSNYVRSAFWILLIVPSILFGWVYSVAFVAACSIYANAASDFASARADDNTEILERLDKMEEMLKKVIKDESSS